MTGINAKLMEEKLKIGWTTDNFAEHLGVSSEEVGTLIEKTFSSKAARGLKSRLDKNDKRFQKNISRRAYQKVENENIKMPEQLINQEEFNQEEKKEPITVQQLSVEQLLQKLREEEQQLRKNIFEDEVSHTNCVKSRKEIKELLIFQRDKLVKVEKTLEESEKATEKLISEFNQISVEMISLNDALSEKREDLQDVQKQIKSLNKVVIYVYDSGEIESENCETIIPDSWNEKYYEIIEMDSMDMLTVKQIKQLAKVISFTEVLEEQNLEFDITFDSENLKSAYKQLQCS